MKTFPKDADYAIRAILHLAMRDGSDYISTATLSGETKLPLNFLRQICSTLVKGEILENKEGAKGGVRLADMPCKITLLRIIELFNERIEISECSFQEVLCPNRKNCVLQRRLTRIGEKLAAEFEAITIQNLLDDINEEKKQSP
ncbi:MAG: Rrf2 family transcriptional regulator [Planctomycetaceae bacterium]|nr:Rrf2 family transcriptional regulator [Planctomycetaceae bacterium]